MSESDIEPRDREIKGEREREGETNETGNERDKEKQQVRNSE